MRLVNKKNVFNFCLESNILKRLYKLANNNGKLLLWYIAKAPTKMGKDFIKSYLE